MHQGAVETVTEKRCGRVGVPGSAGTTGRPTLYNDTVVDEILTRLSEGETLTAACRREGMPSPRTVWEWMQRVPEFAQNVARARAAGADALVQAGLDGLQRATVGPMGTLGRERELAAHRRWMAARMDPSQWGDKMQVNHSGAIAVEAVEAPQWLGACLELEPGDVEDITPETGSEGAQGGAALHGPEDRADAFAHSTVGDDMDLFDV